MSGHLEVGHRVMSIPTPRMTPGMSPGGPPRHRKGHHLLDPGLKVGDVGAGMLEVVRSNSSIALMTGNTAALSQARVLEAFREMIFASIRVRRTSSEVQR